MKKSDRMCFIICITVIFIYGNVLAGNIKFTIVSSVGFALMWLVAYIPCILKKRGFNNFIRIINYLDTWIFLGIVSIFVILLKLPFIEEIKRAGYDFGKREGGQSYIYDVLSELIKNSNWFGVGKYNYDIIKILPEYDTTFVLEYYIAKYGRAAGVFMLVFIAFIIVKIIIDSVKYKDRGRFLMIITAIVAAFETVMAVLMNMAILPFVRDGVFLPFYSANMDKTILMYVLMGIVLGVYINGDKTLRLAVEEAKCQDMIIEFIDSYDMLCDFLHDLGKFDMLLEVLDILEVEMKNFYMPRIRIKLIKHRLECIKADRDFDEYRRWTEEYIKTYELITKNYHQSVLNSIQLRIYIEKLKNSEQTYEKMAIRDGLTQLYNRAGLRKKADKLLQKAAQENQVIGVDIIDIDFFKQVNDSYGHVYGDDCLKSVADILKECCRRNRAGKKNEAIVSRYGGDEFVVFVRNTSEAEMRKFAADVKSELAKANIESNKSPISDLVTLSQGIACKKADKSDDVRKIIDSADKALYEVKENGRNGYKLINNV